MTLHIDTPVLFLIFNRPDVTQQVFNQIRAIKPRHLFVAADGPRLGREEDIVSCIQTRDIINQVDWPCELKTLFRHDNLGCGKAVSEAISWFFDQVEMGIILEDDCLPDLSFFSFCQELLLKFKDNNQVMLIGGTNHQCGIQRGEGSYYFSFYPQIWGWATWRRAWQHYNYKMENIDFFYDRNMNKTFQSKDEKRYYKNKFKQVITNKINSWDYQWVYSIWTNNGISIIPNTNLVTNLGFRNSSTHVFLRDSIREPSKVISIEFPIIHPTIAINREADYFTYKNAFSHSFVRLFRLTKENGIITILKYTILRLFNIFT